ncbi:Uma2 family endonuclease [Kamptonema sp. UHCC 0994]|uniref:Uma2 family endonuclease n=1 Tax=Kamptonema sp. UHCC 0994 TaxID=3031329 RepID=UPI0023B97183|nr:Uma2 family endonuclease [Kamptonema sp. UHCC 0994]MDF0554249.1 Uma2 family endonuclease [Kamptonema sp. UHCC 0994]
MNPLVLEKPIGESTQLITLYDISWEKFEAIEATLDGIPGVRLVYLDGTLDIMTPLSEEHEDGKSTIGWLLELYFIEKGIRAYARGSKTIGNIGLGGRKEPDESYNLQTKKDIPDLVIEVVVTSGGVNVLEIYRRIQVPEVWFWRRGQLSIYCLREQQYEQLEHSELLPELDLGLLVRCANMPDQYDAIVEFRNAIRQPQT